jgi:hypothetical protein
VLGGDILQLEELAMRISFIFAITATTFIAASPIPAAATDYDQALDACGKNPECSFIYGKGKGDGPTVRDHRH